MSDTDVRSPLFELVEREEAAGHDKKSDQIAELQSQVQCLRDQIREERFLGITVVVMLLDFVFFTVIDGLAALALVVMQLLILIPVARRMGMDEIAVLLSRVIDKMAGKSEADS